MGWRSMSWAWIGTAIAVSTTSLLIVWALFNAPSRSADDELEVRELSNMRAARDRNRTKLNPSPPRIQAFSMHNESDGRGALWILIAIAIIAFWSAIGFFIYKILSG